MDSGNFFAELKRRNVIRMAGSIAIICAWTGEKDLALKELATAAQNPGLINYRQLKLYPGGIRCAETRFEKIVHCLAPK